MTTVHPRVSVRGLCETIWNLENEFGLLHKDTAGVYPWPALRVKIYYELAYALRLLQPDAGPQGKTRLALRALRSLVPEGGRNSSYATSKNSDCLVIPSDRGGIEGCPYATSLVSSSLKSGATVSLVASHVPKPLHNLKNLNLVSPRSLDRRILVNVGIRRLATFSKPLLKDQERTFWSNLELELRKRLGIAIPLTKLVTDFVFYDSAAASAYDQLLERIRPSKILVVCHYGRASLIRQAQLRSIPIEEIQHGTITRYHLGYSFPDWQIGDPSIPYFPTRFLSWGRYWTASTPFPLPEECFKYTGFESIRHRLSSYRVQPGRQNHQQILVLSQAALSGPFQDQVYKLANGHPQYHFIFKCHPAEDDTKVEARFANLPNVVVEKNGDLYSLMQSSRYIAGAFSTAVFEAIALGCKPILLPLDGLEYMEDLIRQYGIPVVTSPHKLDEYLAAAEKTNIPLHDVF